MYNVYSIYIRASNKFMYDVRICIYMLKMEFFDRISNVSRHRINMNYVCKIFAEQEFMNIEYISVKVVMKKSYREKLFFFFFIKFKWLGNLFKLFNHRTD